MPQINLDLSQNMYKFLEQASEADKWHNSSFNYKYSLQRYIKELIAKEMR